MVLCSTNPDANSFRTVFFLFLDIKCLKFEIFTQFPKVSDQQQKMPINSTHLSFFRSFSFLSFSFLSVYIKTNMLTCFPFLLTSYPFTRTEYKLNWIVNARILPVNVLNFIRYVEHLFIHLCVSVCERESKWMSVWVRAPAIGFYASTCNRFRDFYYICSVCLLPKAKPKACIPTVIIHSFILILVVSTILLLSSSPSCTQTQRISITFQSPFVFVLPAISMVLFIYTNTKAKAIFFSFFVFIFFPVHIQYTQNDRKNWAKKIMWRNGGGRFLSTLNPWKRNSV